MRSCGYVHPAFHQDGWGANQSSFQSKGGTAICFAFHRKGFCAFRHNCKYAHRCSNCGDTRHTSSACRRQGVFSSQNRNPNYHFGAKSENKRYNSTPIKVNELDQTLYGYNTEKRRFLVDGFSQGFTLEF